MGFVAAALLAIAAPTDYYHWPLDLPRKVTSSFGEYRTGRFHAAIDLRTGGIGHPVFAAEDGTVTRIRCSPWGYGKAIYLRLNDGNIAVYGHLDSFAEPLASYVRQHQHARQNYTVDLYPEEGQFPVERGQHIAHSGETGVGVPHLHWEIRDSANRPMNPRLLGIEWPDETTPTIQQILIAPHGPNGRINSDVLPVILQAQAQGNGRYVTEPVTASGRFGVGIHVIDPANEGANRLGVHTLRTSMGDGEIFRVVNDRISYANMGDGSVAWHPFLLGEGRFLLAWRWPGNQAASHTITASDGWINAPADSGLLTIEAIDFYGNTAVVTIPIHRESRSGAPVLPAKPDESRGTVDMACYGNYLTLSVTFPGPESATPSLMIDGVPAAEGGKFFRVDDRTFRAAYKPEPQNGGVRFIVQHRNMEDWERSVHVFSRGAGDGMATLGDVEIRVPSDAPYGTLFARSFSVSSAPVAPPVSTLGNAYIVWPTDSPIDGNVALSIPAPEGADDPSRVQVYRLAGSSWSAQRTERRGGRLHIETSRFGSFMAMEDDRSPRISSMLPDEGATVASSRPEISARVSDVGSGIASITFTANGEWLLAEWDPEDGTVEWMRDEDLSSGEQEVVITVVDGVGNTTTVRRSITVPN